MEETRNYGPGTDGSDPQAMDQGGLKIGQEVARRLSEVSSAVRDTAMRLGDSGQTGVSRFTDRVADSLESAAHYAESAKPGAIAEDLKQFARRHPEVFLGAAAV